MVSIYIGWSQTVLAVEDGNVLVEGDDERCCQVQFG